MVASQSQPKNAIMKIKNLQCEYHMEWYSMSGRVPPWNPHIYIIILLLSYNIIMGYYNIIIL